jgi:hypothetical protein
MDFHENLDTAEFYGEKKLDRTRLMMTLHDDLDASLSNIKWKEGNFGQVVVESEFYPKYFLPIIS